MAWVHPPGPLENQWIKHLSGQFITTFPAGWSPQMVVKSKGCKGIHPKMALKIRLRIYNKLPRSIYFELHELIRTPGVFHPGARAVSPNLSPMYSKGSVVCYFSLLNGNRNGVVEVILKKKRLLGWLKEVYLKWFEIE